MKSIRMLGIRLIATMTAIAIWLTAVVLFSFSPIEVKAEAITNTANYYSAYIQGIIGSSAKEWGNAGESTQCVELVKYYVEQLWGYSTKNRALGNGNEIYKRVAQAYPDCFTAIDYYNGLTLMPGDIISYHSSGWAADLGHAALVYEVHDDTYKIAEQWQYCETVRTNTKKVQSGIYGVPYTIIGVARPNSLYISPNKIDAPPTEAWIWSNKSTVAVGESISFNFNAIGATNYVIGLYKDGEYLPIIDNGKSDWYTTTFSEPGKYSLHAACYNELGHCDSPELGFIVYDTAPTEGWIWSDKTKIAVGESISFNFNAIGATNYVIGIYKDGEYLPVIDNDISDWYTTTFSEPGNYSIHAACYNEFGHCDSPELGFTVYDSAPTEGWIWSDKSTVAVGESISFNFNAIGANKYVLGIYKDGIYLPVIDNGSNDWYTTTFTEPGKYSIHAACYNGEGHCDSPEWGFTVCDSVPTDGWIWSDKERVSLGEEITFNFNAINANKYVLEVYKDNECVSLIKNGNSDWYSTSFFEKGIYSIHASCYNGLGYCDSPELVFEVYDKTVGDCNADGEFTVSDIVLLQKWLLAVPDIHLPNWQAADLCEDGKLDVFDLCLMKRKLING